MNAPEGVSEWESGVCGWRPRKSDGTGGKTQDVSTITVSGMDPTNSTKGKFVGFESGGATIQLRFTKA